MTVLAVGLALAGCSKKQPVVATPRTPRPQLQTPPAQRRSTPRPPKTVERTREESEPPAPSPRTLEALASPEGRAAHLERIEATIRNAERNLYALQTRPPIASAEDLARIHSLIRQARAARAANDLPSAQSFAQRAEILSTDLRSR